MASGAAHVRVAAARAGGGAGPLLLSFDHGYVRDAWALSEAALLGQSGARIVAAEFEGCRVLYTGQEEQAEVGKTLLLLRNKTTGKVRAVEVGTVNMRANIQSLSTVSELEVDNLELSRKFGSKKQKKQMEHREKLKVNVKTVKEQMKQVVDSVDAVSKLDLTTYMKTDSDEFYIPPINRTADNVKDVYRVNGILTEEQIEKINNEIDGKDYTTELIPYIKNFVTKLDLNATENALLIYANTLLKLYLQLYKELMKKTFKACNISPTINDIALSNFTLMSNNKRSRPNPLKDKALCHAIVILLLLNNFKFELEPFAAVVKMTVANATSKIKAVGAYVSVVGDKKHVVLKLPLNSGKSFARRKSAKF